MKDLLMNLLRRAVYCLLISAVFAFIHWLWGVISGKDNEFLKPFLIGALVLFIIFTLVALISFIVTYIRVKRNPEFMKMNARYNGAVSWNEYKKIRDPKNGKSDVSDPNTDPK